MRVDGETKSGCAARERGSRKIANMKTAISIFTACFCAVVGLARPYTVEREGFHPDRFRVEPATGFRVESLGSADLTVITDRPGAVVFLNGRPVQGSVTPLTVRNIGVGLWLVEASMMDKIVRKEVHVENGQKQTVLLFFDAARGLDHEAAVQAEQDRLEQVRRTRAELQNRLADLQRQKAETLDRLHNEIGAVPDVPHSESVLKTAKLGRGEKNHTLAVRYTDYTDYPRLEEKEATVYVKLNHGGLVSIPEPLVSAEAPAGLSVGARRRQENATGAFYMGYRVFVSVYNETGNPWSRKFREQRDALRREMKDKEAQFDVQIKKLIDQLEADKR